MKQDPLMPKPFEANFQHVTSLEGVEVVEFNHDFYIEKFRDITLIANTKRLYGLRLCAFVDLGNDMFQKRTDIRKASQNKRIANIPFS